MSSGSCTSGSAAHQTCEYSEVNGPTYISKYSTPPSSFLYWLQSVLYLEGSPPLGVLEMTYSPFMFSKAVVRGRPRPSHMTRRGDETIALRQ